MVHFERQPTPSLFLRQGTSGPFINSQSSASSQQEVLNVVLFLFQ